MLGLDLGIDMGTAQTIIAVPGRGIMLKEPSVIAVDKADGHIIACGTEAYDMLGRTPDSILAIRPLSKGVISDYDYAEQMMRIFIRKVCAYKMIKPRAAVSLPASVTEVEQRSAVEAVTASGVRKVVLIEESVAAALGAGLDLTVPQGNMVVDIGAGTTDIAVLSLKGIAYSTSVRIGGADMDEAIIRYMRNRHNLVIGLLTAEQVKKTIGLASSSPNPHKMVVRGRNALTGLPGTQEIDGNEVADAIHEAIEEILKAVQEVLESTPPELAGDVLTSGITMTGGVSQLKGLSQRLAAYTGVECRLAEEPETCVALGTSKTLKFASSLSAGVYDIGQFSYRLSDSMNIS